MDNWKKRIDLVEEAVRNNILLYTNNSGDKGILQARLKAVTQRFSNEIYQFIEKMTAEEIDSYTKLQLEAELLCADAITPLSSTHARLPKLLLPKFNGDVLKWTEYWDRFEASIGNKCISNVDKLAYLTTTLEGDALETIEGLDITSENYKLATDILKERYGRPGAVIDAHYEALHNMKKAITSHECMSTYNEIEKHLRILKSLGEDTNHNNLRKIILNKYPEDLIYEMQSRVKLEDQSVDRIRQLIEQYCTARLSTTPLITSTFTTNAFKDNRAFKRKFPRPSEPMSTKRFKRSCTFCKGNHYNDECDRFTSIMDRKKKLYGKCYICFQQGHFSKHCQLKKTCFHCRGKHNRALCQKSIEMGNSKNGGAAFKGNTFLQTAISWIRDDQGSLHKCRVLLDTGSQRSYISNDFSKTIKADIKEKDNLVVYTFGQNNAKYIESPRVQLEIVCPPQFEAIITVNVVPMIANNMPCFNYREFSTKTKQKLADDGSMGGKIDILIGNDYYHKFVRETKIQLEEDLFLIDTEFGWVCSGHTSTPQEHVLSVGTYVNTVIPSKLGYLKPDLPIKESDVAQLWELESIGIKDCPNATHEEQALQHFNENVRFESQRYHVKWPWVHYPPQIPTNFGLAVGRLTSLLKRLDMETLSLYKNTIQEQESLGIIERVDNFLDRKSHPIHYLPHHCVVKRDGTTNLRLVYDASSKANRELLSLNECLYKGPLLLEDLVGLLLKFRQHKTGIIADIEKAFLQIGLHIEDRDVTRFLWVKDITKHIDENNLQCYRFCRVPFGIITSPFLLNATIRHHLLKSGNKDLKQVADYVYVDNFILGTENTVKANILFAKIYQSLQEVSMNVRQWNSNNKQFLQGIPAELCENKKTTKVLGLIWDTEVDTLEIKSNQDVTEVRDVTKRRVLQKIASVYDPCGLVSPILLPAKIFLQKLWKLKIKWDTKLTADLQNEWLQILKILKEIQKYKIERYVFVNKTAGNFELHCFTDASKDAYAAAVYIKSQYEQNIKVMLLMSKTKITPLKEQVSNLQIPRLELLGVLIGCRLLAYVSKNMEIHISKQYIWTDSQVVIRWLHSNKLLPPFISRRIKEINEKKDVQILYVNSAKNPADVATRSDDLTSEKRNMWLFGPDFLKIQTEYSSNWALTQSFCVSEDLTDSELNPVINESQEKEIEKCKDKDPVKVLQGDSQNIFNRIKESQRLHYPKEYSCKMTDLARSLGVFKDGSGLLRCKGRVALADLPYEKKYPILLPREAPVTEEIISEIHKENYHVGANHTLSLIRDVYWIPQGRSRVQAVLRKCFECRRHGGGPYRLPQMPDLPAERVNYSTPFSFTGLDYIGPLLVHNDIGQTEKRWICLYTCLAVRAVHLEGINDLSAEECTLALRRFIAQRGIPQILISDNATQFKLTAEVLTGSYCLQNNIQWKFIPELAPWHGGFYERLVGLVKHCLKRTIDIRKLRDRQLCTIIKEIELVINTRPLSYLSVEPEHILKPNDFLRLESCLPIPSDVPYLCLSDTSAKQSLIIGWKIGQKLLEEFKKMFNNQYLMALRERKIRKHKQQRSINKTSPKIGDTVQLKGDSNNRFLWKVGKIVNLHKGNDNEVRIATVNVEGKEYTRSIAHLYPLEIEESNEDEEQKELTQNDITSVDIPTNTEIRRSGRDAAHRAKMVISKWTKELVQTIFSRSPLQ